MTHLEQLNKLPEPIRSQAINNIKSHIGESLLGDDFLKSLDAVLKGGFIWDRALEGEDYWEDIHYRAAKGEFDKPQNQQP